MVNYRSPSLIIAGAGSGKTRVLTCRIAYMIEQGVAPHTILALTFTNKAAREMRERIGSLLGEARSRYIWMGTFHSIFARILRNEADRLGYPASFTIYDTSDAQNVVKACIKELNLNDDDYKPRDILSRISLAKNNLITPQSYEGNTVLVAEDRERRRPQFAELYKLYARKCKENGAMDFDDLLLNINILFRDHPDALARYQEKFRYILVDEYQDTNYAQYIIIRRLAQQHGMVCVVGDDAQSIYSFRGAKIENILRFQNDFPGAQVFKLEQNYRSTQTIVNAANSIISHNKGQLKKECFSAGDVGDKIHVVKAYTDREEAEIVIDRLRTLHRGDGAEWSDMAVLYRTNAQSRVLEEGLRRRDVPYRIFGGFSFYQRKEIKDMMGYVRLVVNPRDDEAFRRIINTPARGIGDKTVLRIAELAADRGVSMWEAIRTPEAAAELKTAAKRVAAFVEMIEALSMERTQKTLYELGHEIAARSGLLSSYRLENTPEAQSAMDNIQELLNSMQTFDEQRTKEIDEGLDLPEATIEEWLQNAALLTDMDKGEENKNTVTLMTVHSAKGLEFDHVFIVGMEDNLFPGVSAKDNPSEMEEERRLFYVAVTRARKDVTLSYCENRFKWGQLTFNKPSGFLRDIDPQYLDVSCCLDDDEAPETDASAGRFAPRYGGGYGQRRYGNADTAPGYGGRVDSHGSYGSRSGRYPARGERYSSGNEVRQVRPAMPDPRFRKVGERPATAAPGAAGPRLAAAGSAVVPGSASSGAVAARPSGLKTRPWSPSAAYTVGMRVLHARFGVGEVLASEELAGGADHKVTVRFDDEVTGTKTLMAKFAKLQIVEE